MKTGIYTVLYNVISNLAIALCFIPLILLFWKKMRKDKAYWMVGLYWLATGLVNLPNFGSAFAVQAGHTPLQDRIKLIYNLLDTPLILLIFLYSAPGKKHKKHILLVLFLFLLMEGGLLDWKGYDTLSSALIIGAGMLLVFSYSITGLVQYMKKMEHTSFENSMVFVHAALLFAYGSFIIIYIFIRVHPSTIDKQDSFMIYYISLLLSAVITCLGLWSYGIRRRQIAM
ncbi:MAG TPA: hypothetical protein VK563_02135 [Puia sp.]|nr:hypothetical protein [Puia sp.]